MKLNSIKVKLAAAFILLILIPLSLLGYMSVHQASSMIERDSASSRETIVENKALTLEEMMRTVESLSTEIFTNLDAINITSGEGFVNANDRDEARNSFQQRATSTTTGFSYVSRVAIFAEDGKIHGDAGVVNKSRDSTPFRERTWYKTAMSAPGQVFWLGANPADFSQTATEGEEVISLVRTINKKATLTPVGVIKIDLDIGELIERAGLAGSELDSYSLVDAEGSNVLGALLPSREDWRLPDGSPANSSEGDEPTADAASMISDVDGEKRVVAYRPIEGTEWTLISSTPLSALTKELQSIKRQTLLQIAIFAVIALAAALLFSQRMTGAIARLSGAMKKVENGDLNVRLSSSSKDEIGALTQSFNEMAGRLATLASGVGKSNDVLNRTVASMMTSAESVRASWEETTKSVHEIAIGANEQSESVQRGADMTDELAAAIERSVGRIGHAAELAEVANRYGEEGKQSIAELTRMAERSTESVREVTERTRKLAEQSKQIGEIVKLIREIAARTNILAINASIEAARVGASGKGFLVISDDVRALADQVKVSSQHIEGIVEELAADTDKVSQHAASLLGDIERQDRLIGLNAESFDRLLGAIDTMHESMQQLSLDASAMNEGNRSIVDQMQGISSVAEQTAAACEQVASSAEVQNDAVRHLFDRMADIREQIAVLGDSVSRFRSGGSE
ncbi:methyl-accepting chemotaxis protein [Cohnella thailandensis]|uniref:Methyl-accepting chemotaxis protein n=1 Tax=Cohnella thailandensis TaxID=557557 RepID=A0A841SRB3_9BACL|nr:methyl-accepting chemotaxis protein [Cohnella thailandensis]MBB6634484.1 methyl-accepting chemotaxis protein [Cohnella thailandensis]MBP1972962.1 methyl-accepting chemotaxis protein [Cohnella thailandensis]